MTSLRSARLRRALLLIAIAAAQFGLFELGLRARGHSEATTAFQALFMEDPLLGYRLRPYARARFVTAEFGADIAINGQGVRDDQDIGPKPANERRIVVLGDSIVLSVQVDRHQTFCRLLEARLNRGNGAIRYRVINAGVQGYGPVEALHFFRQVAHAFQPDLVITTIYAGNDAEEAVRSAPSLSPGTRPAAEPRAGAWMNRLRRLVRRSMVLQVLRLRIVAVTDRIPRFGAPPEPPLQSYAASAAPRIDEGVRVSRECVQAIAADAARSGGRSMVMLMPARFQLDDGDYGRLKTAVEGAGGHLVRDGATIRFRDALGTLPVPLFDALPALRNAPPGPDLFFQRTAHLTPRGHEIVAQALEAFIREHGL